jgi:hypothetical protein
LPYRSASSRDKIGAVKRDSDDDSKSRLNISGQRHQAGSGGSRTVQVGIFGHEGANGVLSRLHQFVYRYSMRGHIDQKHSSQRVSIFSLMSRLFESVDLSPKVFQ